MNSFFDDVRRIYGQRAWGIKKGIGTHVTMEFGLPRDGKPYPIGEYSLWISGAPWRLERDGRIIAGSGKDDLSTTDLACLVGDRISAILAEPPYFDIVALWESGHRLCVFCEGSSLNADSLVFFVPHGAYGFSSSGSIAYEASELKGA